MHPVLILLAAAFGAGTGLLVPRAAFRLAVPPNQPWRTECPTGHGLPRGLARGWLGLAICRQTDGCGRYGLATITAPIVTTLASALLAAAVGTRPELPVWLLLVPISTALAVVDWHVHRLPDAVTLPMAGATLTLLAAATLLPGHNGSFTTAALGALVLAAGFLLLVLIHPTGIGLGDAKLALSVGAVLGWYGWINLLAVTFLVSLIGALCGIALLVLRRVDRRTAMPLGPMMLLGALGGLLLGALSR
ncbi:A24 family peptidase [Streptomyces sp. NEAU-S7GS2]|uniref:prepilin peptidase n=1 Tax=Streptomyces sp. NEAU-S7GS2 TaxID=2202000 RepID=UPI000D6EDAF6|nr:A24 family peptidase [Streptomyces sp. NEAU-S7GS2]AWN24835.1 prepilin peptidase [Streptomyces sp. NEAU-S7GS2]